MKLTIKARLIIGFGFFGLLFLGMGIYTNYILQTLHNSTTEITENSLPSVSYAHSINTATSVYRIKELRHALSNNTKEYDSLEEEMRSIKTDIQKNIEAYNTVINSDVDREMINSVQTEWNRYLEISSEVIALIRSQKTEEAIKLATGDELKAYETVTATLEELVDFNQEYANKLSHMAAGTYSNTRNILITVTVIVIIICVFLSLIITYSIVKPITVLVNTADKLALGDVNVNIESKNKDEIGVLMASFKKMIENIRYQTMVIEKIASGDLTVEVDIRSEEDMLGHKLAEMIQLNSEAISKVVIAADQVAAGAKQLSDSSISLSQGSTEQASSVQQLTASIEEVASQTELNAKNANQANQLADNAKLNAIQGNNQMKEMLKAMEEINESSSNISNIIKVIDDIAFQTNILALNAAVEAARAGQHGKGFAVVAEEVRTLAARSANAAKETTEMIVGSIKKTEGGTKIAKDTAEALNQIVNGIDKVATLVNDIASASNEQAIGIGQINQGIMQVSQVVQENSATSEECASASEELSSQAQLLKESVSTYKLRNMHKNYNRYDELNPEVQKMLARFAENESMNVKSDAYRKEVSSIPQIVLSDREFGKY